MLVLKAVSREQFVLAYLHILDQKGPPETFLDLDQSRNTIASCKKNLATSRFL